jgi:small membrane protein
MKGIQLILLPALIILFISYFRWFRNAALDKILIVLIFLAGVSFVLMPDWTTRIAELLGVGRGADLLMYLSIVSFSYIVLLLYSKIKKLENQLSEMVRQQALGGLQDFSKVKNDDQFR